MRFCLCLFSFVLLATGAAFAQILPVLPPDQIRVECFYRLTYRPDSTAEATRTETMRLQVGSKLSRFESLNAVRRDSFLTATILAAQNQAQAGGTAPSIKIDAESMAPYKTIFQGLVIYKVTAAKQVVVYDKIGITHYAYPEPAAITWVIMPAKATVAGYDCQRSGPRPCLAGAPGRSGLPAKYLSPRDLTNFTACPASL